MTLWFLRYASGQLFRHVDHNWAYFAHPGKRSTYTVILLYIRKKKIDILFSVVIVAMVTWRQARCRAAVCKSTVIIVNDPSLTVGRLDRSSWLTTISDALFRRPLPWNAISTTQSGIGVASSSTTTQAAIFRRRNGPSSGATGVRPGRSKTVSHIARCPLSSGRVYRERSTDWGSRRCTDHWRQSRRLVVSGPVMISSVDWTVTEVVSVRHTAARVTCRPLSPSATGRPGGAFSIRIRQPKWSSCHLWWRASCRKQRHLDAAPSSCRQSR